MLITALENSKVGIGLKSVEGKYLYLAGLPEYFPSLELEEATDELLFGDDWLPAIQNAQKHVLQKGETTPVSLHRSRDGEICACECTLQRYQLHDSRPALLLTFVDLTVERKREDMLKALLRELSHRSKNLLAIVQGVASQTAMTSGGLEQFLVKFRGRIAALSAAQDLVTDSNWQGAYFFELANRQFARYLEEGDPRLRIVGDDVLLSPNSATHIGLALHELIVNAITHGALAGNNGRIELSCKRSENGEHTKVEINWQEDRSGSAHVKGNGSQKRFGSTVLERVVPAAVNGDAGYTVTQNQISYHLKFSM